MPTLSRISLALIVLAGCGADSGVCKPQPDHTSDCCCFRTDDNNVYLENTCPQVSLCPVVAISCSIGDARCPIEGAMGPPGPFTVTDEAALDCALQALQAGTPGTLRWIYSEADGGGAYRREVSQHIAADRAVIEFAEELADLGGRSDDVTQRTLRPAEYFAQCLELTDPGARAVCLTTTTTGEVAATCALGSQYEPD